MDKEVEKNLCGLNLDFKITLLMDPEKKLNVALIFNHKIKKICDNLGCFNFYEKNKKSTIDFPFKEIWNNNEGPLYSFENMCALKNANPNINDFKIKLFCNLVDSKCCLLMNKDDNFYALISTIDLNEYMNRQTFIHNYDDEFDAIVKSLQEDYAETSIVESDIQISSLFFNRFFLVGTLKEFEEAIDANNNYQYILKYRFYSLLLEQLTYKINHAFRNTTITKSDYEYFNKKLLDLSKLFDFKSNYWEFKLRLSDNVKITLKELKLDFIEDTIKYNDAVNEWNSIHGDIDNFPNYKDYICNFFRGVDECIYSELPKVYRTDKLYRNENKLWLDYLSSFKKEDDRKKHFEIMCDMQHYGLPTKLLDITYDHLIALFMCCSTKYNKLGEVIIYYVDHINSDLMYGKEIQLSLMSQLSLLPYDKKAVLKKIVYYYATFKEERQKIDDFLIKDKDYDFKGLITEGEKSIARQTIIDIKKGVSLDFGSTYNLNLSVSSLANAVYVFPNYRNERMLAQKAAFILFGLYKDFEPRNLNCTRNIAGLPRIIVTKKENILKELDKIGINEATMFPDKEHVCNYITRKYR